LRKSDLIGVVIFSDPVLRKTAADSLESDLLHPGDYFFAAACGAGFTSPADFCKSLTAVGSIS